MGELPASIRAAWQQIHSAVALHQEVIGPDLAPVKDWDPRPAHPSDVETRQEAALWGRIATTIKRACVAVRSSGNVYVLDEEEIPQASSTVGPHAITTVAAALRPRPGVTWLAVSSPDGTPVKAGGDFSFAAAICWWTEGKLTVAPFGSAERGPLPYMLLPIAVIGPMACFERGPDIHEMFLPYPGYEAFANFDFTSTRSKFETLGALSIRLTMTAVGLLWLIQEDEHRTAAQAEGSGTG